MPDRRRNSWIKICGSRAVLFLIGLLLSVGSGPALAAKKIDVFVLFSAKNKAQKEAIVALLEQPGVGLEFRTYNADFVAVMDYSGRQKALAKLEQAETVVILGERPTKYLRDSELSSNLIVVGAVTTELKSSQSVVCVVPEEFEVASDATTEKILPDHVWQPPAKSQGTIWVVEGDEAALLNAVMGLLAVTD